MRDILFLAHRIPFPPDRGDRIRSWHILKHLAGLARVHLACFADDEKDKANIAGLRRALGGQLGAAHVEVRSRGTISSALEAYASRKPVSLAAFEAEALAQFVKRLLVRKPVGTIFAYSGQMAQFVPAGTGLPFIMDFGDVDSEKFAAYAEEASVPMRWVYKRETEKLLAFERATAARADTSLFVSEAEAELFRRRANLPGADIRALGNGVDLGFYDPSASFPRVETRGEGPLIVFTGQMDYLPNVDAVTAFADQVFPRIQAEKPEARFVIVGRRPTEAVTKLAERPGVRVTGEVEDVRGFIAAADLVVAPLRIARGIQNKVLEAMAMARPVVATPAAFEGIEAEPGRDLIVAPIETQAAAILKLLAEPHRARSIAESARRLMERSYRWDVKLRELTELVSAPRREAAE